MKLTFETKFASIRIYLCLLATLLVQKYKFRFSQITFNFEIEFSIWNIKYANGLNKCI